MKNFGSILAAGIGLVLAVLISLSTSCVPTGHVGVQTQMGALQPGTLSEGFHFKSPLIQVHDQSMRLMAYTMAKGVNEGDMRGDDSVEVKSAEGLPMQFDITVQWARVPADTPELFQQFGQTDEDIVSKIIRPVTRAAIRDASAQFNATEAYSTKRQELQIALEEGINRYLADTMMKKGLPETFQGITILGTLIRNIGLPQQIEDSISRKQQAEQAAQEEQFKLDKAKIAAESVVVEAQAAADAAELEAQALMAQGGDRVLQKMFYEKWDGKMPLVMGGDTPNMFLNLGTPIE